MDRYLDFVESAKVAEAFRNSGKRLILLDYDGTLVPFHCEPSKALPGKFLMTLLTDLSNIANLDLAIISGRHESFLDKIFKNLNATLFGEHGAVFRINGKWNSLENDISWQLEVAEIIKEAVLNTAGSNMELKENSIVWHYRKADEDKALKQITELIPRLTPVCDLNNLAIMKGRKIIEVKPSEYTKGTAILNFFDCTTYDFILAAGDDTTDEDLFEALPASAITIHVGQSSDYATYTVRNSKDFVDFLDFLRADSTLEL
jgi:trehalose 6-phosphate synthase/phosphatase